jgi:hypothetical protein
MDRCVSEEPPLRPVAGDDSTHRSACWLPPYVLGPDDQAGAQRNRVAASKRGPATARLLVKHRVPNEVVP